MSEPDIIIVGAGPGGLAAAIAASRTGLKVEVIEQRHAPGGAIYRQPVDGVEPVPQAAAAKRRWQSLSTRFAESGVPVRTHSVFLGIDGDGTFLIDDRDRGKLDRLQPRGVIIATGAVEKVYPRPGWHLAGVSTVGGLQVMMKETGRAPQGRILLAGGGPLLIAVAAQMARLGNPPVAIVEAGDPAKELAAGLQILVSPGLFAEAFSYLRTVYRHGVPWLRGHRLVSIKREGQDLAAVIEDRKGSRRRILADRIGLHDGIRPNDFGMPPETTANRAAPFVIHAGDCREALGAVAAEADGERAGRMMAGLLAHGRREINELEELVARNRRSQAVLARIFAPVQSGSLLDGLTDETILCRCEGRNVGDLRQLCSRPDPLTGREIKHNGRFAMGACQGRFCAANTAALMARLRPDIPAPAPGDLIGRRWPARPVSIGTLVGVPPHAEGQDEVLR
ncbi:FAD-dependent oxidoreductase [Neorhizobium petrolearium]|uniref:FAD-dependent oxidoreductase n=1 Tax=Neorhizobium petrolearium TaxID=515361 RepID=UPI003F8103BB